MKKIIFFLFLCSSFLYAQQEPFDLGFYFGTEIIMSKTNRGVDQSIGVSTNLGIEYTLPLFKYMNFEPSLDISIFHYAFLPYSGSKKNYSAGKAYICELENRTAFTLAFLLDAPIMAKFDIKEWSIRFGGGFAFLMRGGLLEPGVKHEDINEYDIQAKEEISLINSYFWQNGNFFYPSLGFRVDYKFSSGWTTGVKFKSFLPIFNLWDKRQTQFFDSMIFQIAIVLHPPKKLKPSPPLDKKE